MEDRHVNETEANKGAIRAQLERIFPERDRWYECILTLFRNGNAVNASVIGVILEDNDLSFRLFEGSNAFDEIGNNPAVGLTIPLLPQEFDVYMKAALLGYGTDEQEIGPEDISQLAAGRLHSESEGISVPVVRSEGVHIMVDVINIRSVDHEDSIGRTRLKIVKGEAALIQVFDKRAVPAYSRSRDPLSSDPTDHLMDALVNATRYIASEDDAFLDLAEMSLQMAEISGEERFLHMIERIRGILMKKRAGKEMTMNE